MNTKQEVKAIVKPNKEGGWEWEVLIRVPGGKWAIPQQGNLIDPTMTGTDWDLERAQDHAAVALDRFVAEGLNLQRPRYVKVPGMRWIQASD